LVGSGQSAGNEAMGIPEGMTLAAALRVERGAVISFVGGGGKTSSMFRLATELSSAGFRVLTSTTTHISEEQARISPVSIGWDEIHLLKDRLDRYGQCLLTGPPDGKGRICGASSDLIHSLQEQNTIDAILVEADGSRSLPFKAPGPHEPVVPEATTILVPIAGLNILGQSLDEAHTHRSEIIASLANQSLGTSITPATIARVLSHPSGGAKQLPAGARLIPLLNKADTAADLQHAGEIAELLLANPTVDSVIISSMIQSPPVRATWTSTAGIVLAAGMSTRFGSVKQTLAWEGSSMVARSAHEALDAGLDPVIVVLGCDAENVSKSLAGLPVKIVWNPDFAEGQSTSIRCGLNAVPPRTGAALFILADQPLVTAEDMRAIVRAHRRTFAPACVPMFEEQRGNPVLFDKRLFRELGELRGDTGGRVLLEKYRESVVTVPARRAVLLDIDTPEDYSTLTTRATDFEASNKGKI
jgi:molybdenum cofactor cytidylyltransferase